MNKDMEKINFIKGLRQHAQKSEQWLTQRKGKLTSSDAGTALNLNPYEKPIKLLYRKCGYDPTPFTANSATLHGEAHEAEAIQIYCCLMNKTNYEFGLIEWSSIDPIRSTFFKQFTDKYPHIDLSFLAGSPDGIAIDRDGVEDPILIECKCPYRRKIKWGYCPEYYMPQVQLNMAILDIDKADFIEYMPVEITKTIPIFNIIRVHRNYEYLERIILVLHAFWTDVLHWRNVGIQLHPEYDKIVARRRGPRVTATRLKFINDSDDDVAGMNVATTGLQFREEEDV